MKNHFLKPALHLACIGLAVVMTLFMAGCNEDDMPFVQLPSENIELSPAIEKHTVEVRSNTAWTATSDQNWCRVLNGTGKHQGAFEIVSDANHTTAERTAHITVTGGGCTCTLLVRQSPVDGSLALSTNNVVFMNAPDIYTVTVMANDDWSVTSSSPAWCSVSPVSGSGTGSFNISVTKNTTGRERTADIVVVSQANGKVISQKVAVTQTIDAYYLEVPVTEYLLNKDAADINVKYLLKGQDCTVEVTPNVTWITAGTPGNGAVTLSVTENTTGLKREGTVSFHTVGQAGNPIVRTVTIHQSATENVLDVLVRDINVHPMGETVRIPIVANTTIDVRCSSDWCLASIDGSDIVIEADLNNTQTAREAVVTVSVTSSKGEQFSKTFKVKQAYMEIKFEFPAEEYFFKYQGETRQLLLTATGDWELATSDLPQWLTITPTSGTGNTAITVVVERSRFIQERSFDLVFNSLLLSKACVLKITQERNPSSAIDDYKYLGFGYDVNGEFASDIDVRAQILDWTKLDDEEYIANIIAPNSTEERYVYGKTLEAYQNSLTVKAGVDASFKGFSASVKTSFSTQTMSSSENEFASFRHITKKQSIKLHANLTAADLKKVMTDQAKADINNAAMPTLDLVKRYGTHVITGLILGGSLDYSMTADVSSMSKSVDWGVAVTAGFQAAASGVTVSTEYQEYEAVQKESSNFESRLYARGGESQYTSGKGSQAMYDSWLGSLSDATKWVMVDYDGSKLIPIWEFADDPDRKAQLETEIKAYLAAGLDINQNSSHRTVNIAATNLASLIGDAGSVAETHWVMKITIDGVEKAWPSERVEGPDNDETDGPSITDRNQFVEKSLSIYKPHTIIIDVTGHEADASGNPNENFNGRVELNFDPNTGKWMKGLDDVTNKSFSAIFSDVTKIKFSLNW